MTARGIGKKPRAATPGKRGGRRLVSRTSLAKRPRSSQNKAGRYGHSGAAPRRPAAPKAKPRKATPAAAPKLAREEPRQIEAPHYEPRPISPLMQKFQRGWPELWRTCAQRAVDYIESFTIQKGPAAGQRFTLPPWLEEITREVYGPRHPDGRRICRTLWLEVASKNAKSTYAGVIGLNELKNSGSGGSEVYSVARNRKQARLVFNSARAFALKSEHADDFNIFRHIIEVAGDELAKFEPLVSDEDSIDGVDPQCFIVDEVHRIPPRNTGVVRTLEAKQATRSEPLRVFITTSGEYDPTTIAWELHIYALGVINGTSPDPTWVARIYTVPLQDEQGNPVDWRDKSLWYLANPNLGISVSMEFLESQFQKALKSKQAEKAFRRFHLNQWLSGETKLMSVEMWEACKGPVDVAQLVKERALCCSGLDLSSTRDLTAHVLVFPRPDGCFEIIARCFMPKDRLQEHIENDEVPYDEWERDGWLTLTDGDVIDFPAIRQSIEDDFRTFRLKELAFDRAGAAQMTQELDLSIGRSSGLSESKRLEVVPFGQGWFQMSEPMKDFIDLVRAKKIRHGGNPLLRWQVDCCTTKSDPAGNIKPVKPDRKTHKKRIDAVVALVMGLARAKMLKVLEDSGRTRSVYQSRGVRTV